MRGDEPADRLVSNARAEVFPACAGMNRNRVAMFRVAECVPRMRGDEPNISGEPSTCSTVFPACAGMNRRIHAIIELLKGVPRMRGDEPIFTFQFLQLGMCSPHARG